MSSSGQVAGYSNKSSRARKSSCKPLVILDIRLSLPRAPTKPSSSRETTKTSANLYASHLKLQLIETNLTLARLVSRLFRWLRVALVEMATKMNIQIEWLLEWRVMRQKQKQIINDSRGHSLAATPMASGGQLPQVARIRANLTQASTQADDDQMARSSRERADERLRD